MCIYISNAYIRKEFSFHYLPILKLPLPFLLLKLFPVLTGKTFDDYTLNFAILDLKFATVNFSTKSTLAGEGGIISGQE